jgi:hypothetical protein
MRWPSCYVVECLLERSSITILGFGPDEKRVSYLAIAVYAKLREILFFSKSAST